MSLCLWLMVWQKNDVLPRIFLTTRKLLKAISCLQEVRVCFSARTAKTKGKGLDSVYRHYVWSKPIFMPKVLLKRGVNKVEMTEWTSDVRGSGWRRRGSEAGAQKLRTMEQFWFSTFPISTSICVVFCGESPSQLNAGSNFKQPIIFFDIIQNQWESVPNRNDSFF